MDCRVKSVALAMKWFGVSNKIEQLQDYKGQLIVHWKETPTDDDKQLITRFWLLFNEDQISHFLISKL